MALGKLPITCGVCNSSKDPEKKKKERGCVSPVEKPVYKFKPCPMCGGSGECSYCQSTNEIAVYTCPRTLGKNREVLWLLSHFYAYRVSNYMAWPNGKDRLFQPAKLIMAFDILTSIFERHKDK
jgi:hypothetical protein